LEKGVVHPAGLLACLFGELVEGAVRQADRAAWFDTGFVAELGKELGERQLAVLTGGRGALPAGGREEAFLVGVSRGLEEDPCCDVVAPGWEGDVEARGVGDVLLRGAPGAGSTGPSRGAGVVRGGQSFGEELVEVEGGQAYDTMSSWPAPSV
jgi:hypothetical protein